jgi:hypothetical protein
MFLIERYINNVLISNDILSDWTVEMSYGPEFLIGGRFSQDEEEYHLIIPM